MTETLREAALDAARRMCHEWDADDFDAPHPCTAARLRDALARSESPSPAGLDVARLAEAVFRVGTGYHDRATATIAARIANSQDGARASREFAEVAAVEYARLAERQP